MKDREPGLSPELMLQAYMTGIFPMAESRDDPNIFWVDPRRRGIFPLEGFRISRSLARAIRRPDYTVTTDRDFAAVITGCADRAETWINDEITTIYQTLFDSGHAHSVEVRDLEGALIGGAYGVSIGGAFFGESMFSRRRDASKIALAWLVDRLAQAGYSLFDTQFITSHLASLGAVEIRRAEYHARLAEALRRPADFNDPSIRQSVHSVLQRRTQTS
ncbi:leucyl/phenylalanyl-tRNA--protein transferase [Pseudooceanicola aestuarii]|uniref:leucyl/phenylalanyl-tRNA--protein transferase n=1 Tax=Pseudooceanicola aestuarii TaxID=2697319 RepID=UPI0013D72E91|nr:leucyl/phenylalanyl-tRNA--protein transferase [Pseudooceanicola aestuarii]